MTVPPGGDPGTGRAGGGRVYDVAVIGAGVVGAAIARELSGFQVSCVLLEAGDDVGAGTSKANTAIRHTGFDAKPGTLEAALLARAFPLLREYAAAVGIPLRTTGALLVAWSAEQLAAFDDIVANARANHYTRIARLSAGQLYAREPHLGAGALGALQIPDEGIICPFTTPLAFATDAVANGVELRLGARVVQVRPVGRHQVLTTTAGQVAAGWVINAAGLYSDAVDRLYHHETFTVTPRRGELIVFDKLAGGLVNSVLLPVPTKITKGVLVAPTVYGNVLLGPTAEDVPSRTATGSTARGVGGLLEAGRRIVPRLVEEEVTAVYAGLRAATEHGDYQIAAYPDQRYIAVGGIRSTGLSAAMGIASYVVELLTGAGVRLPAKAYRRAIRMPNIGEAGLRPYRDEDAIRTDPAFGEIVCHCERVTRGEILAAATSAVPARGLDGIRRRTRAMLGRCQGFYCGARVAHLLAAATGRSVDALLGLDTVAGDAARATRDGARGATGDGGAGATRDAGVEGRP